MKEASTFCVCWMRSFFWCLFAAAVLTSSVAAQTKVAAGGKAVLTIPGAGRETHCAAFSPDGKWLAAGGQGLAAGEVKIFSVETGKEALQLKLQKAASAVAFSPDGARLAAAFRSGVDGVQSLSVWDLATAKEVYVLDSISGPQGWAFRGDGKQLATWNTDKTITVWEATSGEEAFSFAPEGLKDYIVSLRWRPVANEIVGAEHGSPGWLHFWDGEDGKKVRQFQVGERGAGSFEFSSDGRRVATEIYLEGLRVWDAATGRGVAQTPFWRVTHHSNLAYSPNGKLIAWRGAPANYDKSGPIKVWSGESGKELFEIKDRAPKTIVFSPDSSLLAGTLERDGVMVWQVARPDPSFRPTAVTAVALPEARPDATVPAPRPREEAAPSATASIVPKPLSLKAHTDPEPGASANDKMAIVDLALSPEQTKLASVSGGGEVVLWDLKTGEPTTLAAEGSARHVLFTADGTTLLAGNGTQVSAWDVETTAGKGSFGDGSGSELGWYAARDGSAVATLDYPGDGIRRIRFWSVADAETPLLTLDLKENIECLAIARKGTLAAMGGQDNDVRLFDLAAKREIEPIRGLPYDAEALLFHPNGRVLVVETSNGNLQFWDVSRSPARLVARQETEWSPNNPWFFSDDGQQLVLAESEVQIWDAATRALREPIAGLTRHASLSADGGTIVGLTQDTTTVVADAKTGQVRTVIEVALPNGEPAYKWGASGAYAVSRDGGFVAIGTKSGAVEVRPLVTDASGVEELVFQLKPPELVTRGGASFRFPGIGFSADGKYVVYRREGWTAIGEIASRKVWVPMELTAPSYTPRPLRLRSFYFKPAERALIALSDKEQSVWKYDLATGRVAANRADRREYYSFEVSPDQSKVAAILTQPSKPTQLALLDPDNGKVVGAPPPAEPELDFSSAVSADFAFTPDGKLLALAMGRNVRVWDLEKEEEKLLNATGDWEKVFFVAGESVVVAVDNKMVVLKLFDLETGQTKTEVDVKRLHTGAVNDVAVSPTDPIFVSVGENGEVLVRDLMTGDLRARFTGHEGEVDAVAFTADGSTLATGCPDDWTIRLWKVDMAALPELSAGDMPPGLATPGRPAGQRAGIQPPREIASMELELGLRAGTSNSEAMIELSPDASLLAVGIGQYGSPVHLADVTGKQLKWKEEERASGMRGGDQEYRPYRFSADGRQLLAWSGNGRGLVTVDVATGESRASHDKWTVCRFEYAPDGKTIAFGGDPDAEDAPLLMLLDRDTLTETGPKLEVREEALTALAYSPDGSQLAVAIKDRKASRLQLLDPATLSVQATLAEYPPSFIAQIAFAPDGKSLWVTRDRDVEIWNVAEKKLLRSSESETLEGYTPVAFVGSSALMLLQRSGRYIVYDVATDKARQTLEGYMLADITPDGRLLATLDKEKVVVWDLLRGRQLDTPADHGDTVLDAALSDDGRRLVTVAIDNTVKVWSLDGTDGDTAAAP